MVPGARIELATPAFSGRRSTNELPRQLNFSSLVADSNAVKLAQNFPLLGFFLWSAQAQLPLLQLKPQHQFLNRCGHTFCPQPAPTLK